MNKLKHAVYHLLLLLPLGGQCFAQPVSLSECQAIANREARFECYDKIDAASGRLHDAAQAAQQAPEQVQAPEKERSLFTRIFNRDTDDAADESQVNTTTTTRASADNVASAKANSNKADRNNANSEFELIDRIVALEQPKPYVWLITLAGGETWQQTSSKRYNLEKGDEVRIYPSPWGSNYRLSTAKAGGYIQVKRAY